MELPTNQPLSLPNTYSPFIHDNQDVPMGKTKKEIIDQYMKMYEEYNRVLKQAGIDKLHIFNKFVLQVEKGKIPLAPVHKKLAKFIQDDTHKKKLILMPRGHLKSTLVTIGYSVQQIAKNPNIRILLLSATWQMAVDFLTEIKNNLTRNETFIELYGDLAQEPTEWSQDRITLKRTDMNIKGPTVWAAGIDSNLVGSHPDMIIFDDVVNRDNTQTREQIDKVILRYKDALDLLEPGGQLIVIGTRWVEGDLYDWIMDKSNEIHKSFDVMVEKSFEGNIETGDDFQALWPEKFSLKELRDRLREKGWYEFSAQYQNDPVPDQDATFKRSWFQYYDREELKGKEMMNIMYIDPAIALKKTSDYTAMGVVGIDTFTNLYIKDLARGHWKPNEIIDNIFTMFLLWHPRLILLESIAYQQALAYALREEMQKRGVYLPIHEIKYHETTKDQRIQGLQPIYMNKKVWHPKGVFLVPYMEEELLKFPRGKHDDQIDGLSMTLDYLVAPREKKTHKKQRYLY
jgi:predicted phage terminase large subunit-like protein